MISFVKKKKKEERPNVKYFINHNQDSDIITILSWLNYMYVAVTFRAMRWPDALKHLTLV